jgi:PhoH-like ATPase
MRVKADILGIAAEDFRNEKVAKIEDQYTGRAEVWAGAETINGSLRR